MGCFWSSCFGKDTDSVNGDITETTKLISDHSNIQRSPAELALINELSLKMGRTTDDNSMEHKEDHAEMSIPNPEETIKMGGTLSPVKGAISLPAMCTGDGGPHPSPPPSGMGGPPPPPPPPPPPSALLAQSTQDIMLQLGMKRKKRWSIPTDTKRTNWKQISVNMLTNKSFWTQVDEERLANQSLIEDLTDRFSLKPPTEKVVKKKTKELKVLDPKAAQNLSILLGGALKHISYDDLRKCILRCDTSVLTENLLQSLILYLPSPEQLKKLKAFQGNFEELAEAEQFSMSMADIERLVPRLKFLQFRIHFPELMQDCRTDIMDVTTACEEVKQSKKFAKLLEIILLFGNIMNTGSRNEQSVGFDISYLPKLSNTKDRDNKSTLIHFLVETVEKYHPECTNFADELIHVDKAARISSDQIQKVLKQMDTSIQNLETDLKNVTSCNTDPADHFETVMGYFSKEARGECDILQVMFNKMDMLYSTLGDYYVFDQQKYHLDHFFSDIKQFKDNFKSAHEEILKDRESEAKLARARGAREKKDKEQVGIPMA